MTDQHDHDASPEDYGVLPMQPTGSGVADLEVAYEQMKLAEDADVGAASDEGTASTDREDVIESAAHPS